MRTFLVLLMVFSASGDDEMTVNGFLRDHVLLPCSCPNRNVDKDFKWQMEKPNKTMVYKMASGFSDKYKGRGKVFLDENSSNCSILLTNITQNDQGEYRCIFNSEERYRSFSVNLNISGKSSEHALHKGTLNPPNGSQSACFMSHLKTTLIMVALGFSLISEMII